MAGRPLWIVAHHRAVAAALITSLGYLAGVCLGLELTLPTAPISTLWPPNAILLTALLCTPARRWWLPALAVLPAHLIAEVMLGVPLPMAACWYVSNFFEAALGATLIGVCLHRVPKFDRVRDVAIFTVAAGILAPALSSFVDVGFVAWIGWRYDRFWHLWYNRTLSNALAALIVVPLLLTVIRTGWRRLRTPRTAELLEMIGLLGGLCITSAIVFAQSHPPAQSLSWLWAPMAFLLWAALRRGVGAVSLSIAVIALFAIAGVINGRGPFIQETPEDAAQAVQIFLLIACPSMMLLAATLAELTEAQVTARRQTESLEFALEAAHMHAWEWDQTRNLITEMRAGSGRTQSLYEILDTIHPDDRQAVMMAMTDIAEGQRSDAIEFRMCRKDGGTRWVSSRGKLVRAPGRNAPRVIGVCSDITSRRAQEAQLVAQREQIARLHKVTLLGALSAALAHELKQPLAAILSNAQAARRALAAREPNVQEIREILSDIIAENRRTLDVLERLRSLFTRGAPEAGVVDVNACVREVLCLERDTLSAAGVCTQLDLGTDVPQASIGHAELHQVLTNLIANACDAVQHGAPGQRHISISTRARDSGVTLEIGDSGPGVADTEAVFGAFFTTKPHGLGLGLSICRTIVTAHGGRLRARNKERTGAIFEVWIPAREAHAQPGADRHITDGLGTMGREVNSHKARESRIVQRAGP